MTLPTIPGLPLTLTQLHHLSNISKAKFIWKNPSTLGSPATFFHGLGDASITLMEVMKTNVPSILEVLCTSIFGDNSSLMNLPPTQDPPPPRLHIGSPTTNSSPFLLDTPQAVVFEKAFESCNHPIIPRKRKSTEVSCFLISPSHTLYCLFCGSNWATVPSAWVEDETNKELRWRFLQAPTCVFNLNAT